MRNERGITLNAHKHITHRGIIKQDAVILSKVEERSDKNKETALLQK